MIADPADLGVAEALDALRASTLSSVELTEACLRRIATRDPAVGAWLHVDEEAARDSARDADRRRAKGRDLPLLGVPVGLKGTIGAAGRPLTGDSRLLAGNVATADATAWRGLLHAGMVLLGHLRCGELACGPCDSRNPWDPAFSPGGSSTGSAVALATRTVGATLGSDTRGSIREPAGFNGVTGLKPSFGLVSTAGCLPISFSYDVVGPMARSAADCALLLRAMVCPDRADPPTLAQAPPASYPREPRPGARPLSGTRIGIPCSGDGVLAAGVDAVLDRFHRELEQLGATLVRFGRPPNPLDEGGYSAILASEAAIVHAQFSGRERLHRPELAVVFEQLRERESSAEEYLRAQMQRGELVAAWRSIFADHRLDAIVEPGSTEEIWRADRPVDLDSNMGMYGTWSDASFPVLMLPAGFSPTDAGPIGMQVVGLPFREDTVLQIGIDYQAATDHHRAQPPNLGEPVAAGARRAPPSPDLDAQPAYVWERNPFDALLLR